MIVKKSKCNCADNLFVRWGDDALSKTVIEPWVYIPRIVNAAASVRFSMVELARQWAPRKTQ